MESTKYTENLRNSGFIYRLLLTGTCVILAQDIFRLALPLALHEMKDDASTIFYSVGVSFLPNLLFALFIGVLIDAFNRKTWTLVILAGNSIAFVMLGWLLEVVESNVFLYVMVFLISFLNYCFGISRTAVVKEMLEGEQILRYNSNIQLIDSLASIIAPVLAGMLIAVSASENVFYCIAALYLFAFLSCIAYPDMPKNDKDKASGLFRSIKEGLNVLIRNKMLWKMSWIVAFVNVPLGAIDALLVLHLKQNFELTSGELGLFFSVGAIGAIVGSILAGHLRHFGLGRIWVLSIFLLSGVLLGFSVLENIVYLASLFFFFNIAGIVFNVFVWTYRQESTDVEHIGRVAGITGSIFKLLLPVALIVFGIVNFESYNAIFLVGSMGLALVGLVAKFIDVAKIK